MERPRRRCRRSLSAYEEAERALELIAHEGETEELAAE